MNMIALLVMTNCGAVKDDGADCLAAWEQKLRTAKSISGELVVTKRGESAVTTFQMVRPNLYLVKGDGMVWWSDGRQEGFFSEELKQYSLKKSGRRLPGISAVAFGMAALSRQPSNFDYKSFSESEGKLQLKMMHKAGAITMIDERGGISGAFPMTLTFNSKSRELEGFALDSPDGPITGEYRKLRFDAQIEASQFSFQIPKTAQPFPDLSEQLPLLKVGEKAPDVTLRATDGSTITLSKFVKTRKATLVNFWFYGCGGCMIEFPNISRLNEKYSKQGFGVLGLNPVDDMETATKYHNEGKFSFPSMVAKAEEVEAELGYMVQAYPTNYVLGPDMTILDAFIGEDEDRLLDAMEKVGIKVEEER